MWSQKEGNYADNPPTQPYTCGNAANPCVRWTANSNLLYLNSTTLLALPGDPVGDIDFILQKYSALTGPSPNLTKSTGSYQILNYAYDDPAHPGTYALSLSTAGSDHYFISGWTKYNLSATFAAGYRPVECHEILHVLGFNHITVNGHIGSKATCMGYSFATGPGVDDQYLLSQTYSAPVGP
jgi:hypothetical protein